jgi:predicted acyltransferase (DUF342 family)
VTLGDVSTDKIVINGATELKDTLTVAKATTLNDTLTVTKAATLDSTLTVKGNTTLGDTADDTVTIKGSLTVQGNTTLGNDTGDTVTIKGATTLNNNLTVNGNTTLGNDTGDTVTISGATTINGAATFKNGATVTKNGLTVSDGGLTVTKGGLIVSAGGANITGTLSVSDIATVKQLVISNTNAVKHIAFKREGLNYVTAPTDGGVAFIPNGKELLETNSNLVVRGENVIPGATNKISLGTDGRRWSTIYGNTLNISGASTLTGEITAPGGIIGDLTGNATSADKASADGDGNVFSSYYCTLSTEQTISAKKIFSQPIGITTAANLQWNATDECIEIVFN